MEPDTFLKSHQSGWYILRQCVEKMSRDKP